jgi:HD-like signal output (HDOD) protein
MQIADSATAYTAGLIHDLGKFALAYANFTALDEIANRVPDEFPTWREAEKAILGFESTEVTKALLENWGFPSTFVSVGYYYQIPSEAPEEERKIVTLIHAAKHVATQLGYGVGVDGFYYEPDEVALKEAGFKDAEMDAAIPEILATIQRFISPTGEIRFT